MLLKGIYVLSLQFSCSVEITKKTNVQIINNKEAPWITLSKQHLAHDSQLEQQSLRLLRVVVVWFSADTFQLLTKESKEKKKNLHEGSQAAGLGKRRNCFHCMQISKITLYSYISTLWDVLSITTDILFKIFLLRQTSMGSNYKS